MMTALPVAGIADELFAARERLALGSAESSMAAGLARFVGRIGNRLARPPRIVLIGEFNSGKSTLANALIGAEVLPTSIHANTRVPILIHHSEEPSLAYEDRSSAVRPLDLSSVHALRSGNARLLRVGLPVERLRQVEIIDTPGLATGSDHIDELCLEACRRSHIAVWCTVATQAWKATEQQLWASLPGRLRQRSVLAVTHRDAITNERDDYRLLTRLQNETASHFGSIVMLAAADAVLATRLNDAQQASERWLHSGGRALEESLTRAIEGELKLRHGSAERLIARTVSKLTAGALPALAS